MSLPDLTTLSDEDLRDGYREYSEEISRRHELASGPERVREIALRHVELHGDPQVLTNEIHTAAQDHETAMQEATRGETATI